MEDEKPHGFYKYLGYFVSFYVYVRCAGIMFFGLWLFLKSKGWV